MTVCPGYSVVGLSDSVLSVRVNAAAVVYQSRATAQMPVTYSYLAAIVVTTQVLSNDIARRQVFVTTRYNSELVTLSTSRYYSHISKTYGCTAASMIQRRLPAENYATFSLKSSCWSAWSSDNLQSQLLTGGRHRRPTECREKSHLFVEIIIKRGGKEEIRRNHSMKI